MYVCMYVYIYVYMYIYNILDFILKIKVITSDYIWHQMPNDCRSVTIVVTFFLIAVEIKENETNWKHGCWALDIF